MTMVLPEMRRLEAVVFDLDDTLYPERAYVLSGFRRIADITAKAAGVAPRQIWEFLRVTSEDRRCRGRNLDLLLSEFPGIALRWNVSDLVREYRCHTPEIKLFPGAAALLDDLRAKGMRVGLITDGPPDSQHRKIEALDLAKWVEVVVVTDDSGAEYRKPHPFAFRRITERFACRDEACVYVGDNPAKDFVAPRAMGWLTIRLRMPMQLREREEPGNPEAAPEMGCSNYSELQKALSVLAHYQDSSLVWPGS